MTAHLPQQPYATPAGERAPQQFKPLPDLARGYFALKALTGPMLGVLLPCIALFFIAIYTLGFSAISGVSGRGLGIAVLGWLCLLASVVTSALTVRRMVRDYARAGSQLSSLIWLGLVLPAIGYVLTTVGPLSSAVRTGVASANGAPTLVLFVLGVLLTPTTALTYALNVRRIERSYGAQGFAALWALQQGQLTREYEHVAPYRVVQQFAQAHGNQPQQHGSPVPGQFPQAPFQYPYPTQPQHPQSQFPQSQSQSQFPQAQFPQAAQPEAPLFHQPPASSAPPRPETQPPAGVTYLPPGHESQVPIQLPPPLVQHPQEPQQPATGDPKPEQPSS